MFVTILNKFKIRTKLMIIIAGCSFALVCLGLAGIMYAKSMHGHLERQFTSSGSIASVGELLVNLAETQKYVTMLSTAEDGKSLEANCAEVLKRTASLREISASLSNRQNTASPASAKRGES